MTQFRVWAPRAQNVEVVLRGSDRHPLDGPDEFGWFSADVDDAGPGDDYAYSLDGGDPRPDPRSPWQPEGVHGPSRLVDHAAFRWADSGWGGGAPLAEAVIYELHVDTFSAEETYDGVVPHLDHLVALGVTHVELLPVVEYPGRWGWGYDGVDLYAPNSGDGGPDGLKRLVDACHAKGLGVIFDVVYNHLGPSGNYLGEYGPYFTQKYGTPWGEAVNLDGPDSDPVREFVVDNALTWLRDYHADGLRLDAIHAIVDTSALHILEELAGRVDELEAVLRKPKLLIAESDLNDPRVVADREVGGYGMDAQWSDDFHHALHALLTGERAGYYADFGSVGQLAKALRQAFVYDGGYSPHRRRRHGRAPTGIPATRFLGYLHNHDQIGNRAQGERSSVLLARAARSGDAGAGLLRVAAAIVLLGPWVPMLFQGEEWGASTPFQYFTDHDDPELGKAVTEGRRREFASFGWDPSEVPDPQDPETFRRSKLDWDELGRPPHAGILDWHKQLIALRRSTPELGDGRFDTVSVVYDEDERWLVFRHGPVTVACNLGEKPATVPIPTGTVALSSADDVSVDGNRGVLSPESALVLRTS
ncbi:MAG: malto-oligosyltrehalose trehalohydrolase [Actinomycetota bacterium]|nr:malto-oligosyltrehalose trehalohydrolase [Actinomycetota bacterium]